jgi:hypothetical protein
MSDAALRDLERAFALAPGDRALGVQLARGLARAGRRSEAFSLLEPATIPAELWAAELERLEPVTVVPAPGVHAWRVALDLDQELLVWAAMDGSVHAASATTGRALAPIQGVRPVSVNESALRPARGRVFVWPDRWGPSLSCIEGDGAVVTADLARTRVVRGGATGSTLGVEPTGGRVHLATDAGNAILRWPTLEPLLERDAESVNPIVDWTTGHLVEPTVNRSKALETGLRVHPLDGSPSWQIPGPRPEVARFDLARPGVALVWGGFCLRLVGFVERWTIPLITWTAAERRGRPTPHASLASDGRGVRLSLGGEVIRLEVDLAERRVVAAPPDLAQRSHVTSGYTGHGWHPHADVAHFGVDAGTELRDLAGRVLLRVPKNLSCNWTPDGRGLVVVPDIEGEPGRIEIWRAPP